MKNRLTLELMGVMAILLMLTALWTPAGLKAAPVLPVQAAPLGIADVLTTTPSVSVHAAADPSAFAAQPASAEELPGVDMKARGMQPEALEAQRFSSPVEQTVVEGPRAQEVPATESPLAPAGTGTIVGTVSYSTGGGPVPAGGVNVTIFPNPYDPAGVFNVSTDANGVYTAVVSAGKWSLTARTGGYTLQQAPLVNVGTGQTVSGVNQMLLPQNATVTGHVRDQNAAPVAGATVVVRDAVTGNWLQYSINADASGAFTMPVAAGTWHLYTTLSGYVNPPDPIITVGAGGTLVHNLLLQGLYARIIGTVKEQTTNTPLAGASVYVYNTGSSNLNGPPGTTSDASGAYTLSVYAGTWGINANKTGWTRLGDLQKTVTDTQKLTGVSIILPKVNGAIQGSVTLSGGIPVAYAYVEGSKQPVYEYAYTNADASGFYTLPVSSGTWTVDPSVNGYTSQHNPRVSVGNNVTVTQNLVLLPNTASLQGIVRDQYGQPVPYAHIDINDASSGRRVVPYNTGNVDASGQYSIGVAAGTWQVNVYGSNSYSFCSRNFTVANGQTLDPDLRMTLLDSAISGTMRDDYGNVITQPVSVFAYLQWGCAGTSTTSDSSGHFVISASRGVWGVGSNTTLAGFLNPAQPSVLMQAAQTLPNYDLIYQTLDNTVTGNVRDSFGSPVPGVLVNARFNAGNNTFRVSTNTDASGSYTLSLSSGTWRISVPVTPTLTVAPRQRALVLLHNQTVGGVDLAYLDTSATIRGTVLGNGSGISGTTVFGTRLDGASTSVIADPAGTYTLPVAPGDWLLSPADLTGFVTPPASIVHVGSGATIAPVNLSYISGTARLRGQMRLSDGTPLPGFGINAGTNLNNGPSVPSVFADASGYYTLPVSAGQWRTNPNNVFAFTSQPSRSGLYIADGQTTQMDFVYAPNDAYFRGQVRDAAGMPKSGVFVSASKVGSGEGAYNQSTDANGMYTLSVSTGSWFVGPYTVLPGYTRPQNQTARAISGQTTQNLDFVYAPNSASISGHVTVASVPVSSINIFVNSPIYGSLNFLVTTDNNGAYNLALPPGMWSVFVNTGLSGYVSPPGRVVNLSGALTGLDFDYALADRNIVGVVRANGVPRARMYVNASRTDGAGLAGNVTTDAAGVYTLAINAGFWNVVVNSDQNGYARPPTLDVDAVDGSVASADLNFQSATAIVIGRFRTDGGLPLAGANARGFWDYGRTSPSVPNVWTDLNGVYTLPLSVGAWQAGQNVTLGGLSVPPRIGVSLGGGQVLTGNDQVYVTNAGSIAGTVRDTNGNSVAGAFVQASELRTGRGTNTVVADSSGRYRLSVSDGLWQVGTTTPIAGFSAPPFRSVEVTGGASVGNIDLTYSAASATLVGTVRDSSGNPLPMIPVNATNQSGIGALSLTTDASGQYRMPVAPGTWAVQPAVALGGFIAPGSRVVDTSANLTTTIDFTYTAATGRIQGTITDDTSTPLQGVRMSSGLAEAVSGGFNAFAPISASDDSGRYAVRTIGGLWFVSTGGNLPGRLNANCCDVHVGGAGTITVNLVYSNALTTISGRVTAGGLPLRGARVTLNRIEAGFAPGVPFVYTDGDGDYTAQVAPGAYTVFATARYYIRTASSYVVVGGSPVSGADLSLEMPTGALSGIVRDMGGRPLQGVTIWLMDKDLSGSALNTDGSTMLTANTNSAGAYYLPAGVGSEPYFVLGGRSGYAQNSIPINFGTGDNQVVDLTLAAQAWGTLEGRITSNLLNPVDLSAFSLRQPGGTHAASQQNGLSYTWLVKADTEDGYYIASLLSPGSYTLHGVARGYQSTDVAAGVGQGGDVTANVILTPTAIPASGAAYYFVNMPVTMTAGSYYYALLSQTNVGNSTWAASGVNSVTLGYRWMNAGGATVLTQTAASTLLFDVLPSGRASSKAIVTPPAAAGVYTLTWDMVQNGAWFADLGSETQSIVVTVLGSAPLPDLAVQNSDLWVAPPLFQAGAPQSVTIGLNVYNVSSSPAANVGVCFYDGTIGGTPIGACPLTVALLAPNSWQVISTAWSNPGAGTHTIFGVVDPFNTLSETLKSNNVASGTLAIHTSAADIIPPQGRLLINGGAPTTAVPSVTLNVAASDGGGSGVRAMQIVEFAFDVAGNHWYAVQTSGWITVAPTYPWTLTGTSGDRILRAWFADGAYNVSTPAIAAINLTPACDPISAGQWRQYGQYLSAGTIVTLTLAPCAGDSDLFVWSPASHGEADFYSTNAGTTPDVVAFTALDSGFYRFYVSGFTTGSYSLSMTSVSGSAAGAQSRTQKGTRVLVGGKTLPPNPPISGEDPPPYTPLGTPNVSIWPDTLNLPLIRR